MWDNILKCSYMQWFMWKYVNGRSKANSDGCSALKTASKLPSTVRFNLLSIKASYWPASIIKALVWEVFHFGRGKLLFLFMAVLIVLACWHVGVNLNGRHVSQALQFKVRVVEQALLIQMLIVLEKARHLLANLSDALLFLENWSVLVLLWHDKSLIFEEWLRFILFKPNTLFSRCYFLRFHASNVLKLIDFLKLNLFFKILTISSCRFSLIGCHRINFFFIQKFRKTNFLWFETHWTWIIVGSAVRGVWIIIFLIFLLGCTNWLHWWHFEKVHVSTFLEQGILPIVETISVRSNAILLKALFTGFKLNAA